MAFSILFAAPYAGPAPAGPCGHQEPPTIPTPSGARVLPQTAYAGIPPSAVDGSQNRWDAGLSDRRAVTTGDDDSAGGGVCGSFVFSPSPTGWRPWSRRRAHGLQRESRENRGVRDEWADGTGARRPPNDPCQRSNPRQGNAHDHDAQARAGDEPADGTGSRRPPNDPQQGNNPRQSGIPSRHDHRTGDQAIGEDDPHSPGMIDGRCFLASAIGGRARRADESRRIHL